MATERISFILDILIVLCTIILAGNLFFPKDKRDFMNNILRFISLFLSVVFGIAAFVTLFIWFWGEKESVLNNPVYVIISTIAGAIMGLFAKFFKD
ncbi:hypothetical protein N9954_07950 [Maribacter sp.]|nr:hypothetical protein [Maribacter sp.]